MGENKKIKCLAITALAVLLIFSQTQDAHAFSGQDVRNFFGSVMSIVSPGQSLSGKDTPTTRSIASSLKEVKGISIDADVLNTLQKRVGSLELQFGSLPQQTTPSTFVIDTAGGNLLRNSSFEAGGAGSIPSQWNAQLDSNSGNTFISAEGIHSGSYGLKFNGGGTGNFGISQPNTKTTPQRTYTLSAYVKIINSPGITLRLGFWDEYNNKEGAFKNFALSGTQDWKRVYMNATTPGLITDPKNWYPMIQVQGLKSGNIYLDDVQLTEGSTLTTYNTALANGFSNSLTLGDGSILTSTGGDLYPAQSGVGNLGTSNNKWNSLNLSKATIDNNGNLNLSGGATINGAAYLTSLSVNNNLILSSTQSAIPVNSGGTGQTTFTANGVLYGNGTNGITALTPGTSGYMLQANGTGSAPSWIAATSVGAAFSSLAGGTNTSAAMVVGTGASLAPSGSGTINANQLNGQTTSIGGALTTAAAFTTSGANALTLTTTGATNVTLPATGTLSTLTGTEILTNKTLTAPTINGAVATTGLTLPAFTASGNITGSGSPTISSFGAINGLNLSSASLTPASAGTLSVTSNGANALTLDAGGAAAINIGNTNANALAFGNGTANPTYTFNGSGTFSTSTGTNTLNGNTAIAANKTLTLSSGTGTITQNYSNTSGSATTLAVTNSNAGAGTSVNGLAVNLVGTAPSSGVNTNTGINFGNVSAVANNTFNAITFGTGYTNFVTSGNINISSSGVISGAGSYNGVSLSSTTIQPVAAGAFTFQSNGANTVTLDTGGAAGVNIGTLNANAITMGANTTVSAGRNLVLSSGAGQFQQTYTSGAASNAQVLAFTNSNAGAGVTIGGLDITPTNTIAPSSGTNTLNLLSFEAGGALGGSDATNGLNFLSATGYTNFLKTPSIVISSAGNITGAGTIGSGAITDTSSSANALAVGQNGATNPAFNIDASTVSSATGLNIKSAAAGGGLAVSVISSGAAENLTLDAKGTGTITFNGTGTGNITLARATTVSTGGLTVSAGGLTVSAGGAAITGASTINGSLTLGPSTSHVISSQTTAPTAAAGAGAGTGPSGISVTGSDTKGTVNITLGTTPGTGAQVTVTFNSTYASAPIVVLTPVSTQTNANSIYVTSTATTFTVNASAALTASNAYSWNYVVLQ